MLSAWLFEKYRGLWHHNNLDALGFVIAAPMVELPRQAAVQVPHNLP